MRSGRLWRSRCFGSSASGLEAELCSDGVADHGERYPGTEEWTVSTHETASVGEGEEGTPELLGCATAFAESVACGEIEHPDAYDGEDDKAGDPDVLRRVVLLQAGDDETGEQGDQSCEQGAENLWLHHAWIGMVEGDDPDDDDEKEKSQQGVSQEPEGLPGEVADGFIPRAVWFIHHDGIFRAVLAGNYPVRLLDLFGGTPPPGGGYP